MAFKTWQTGVHIQQDRVLIAALARERGGWCLRRWWAFTLAEGTIRDGKICQPEQLVNALRDWRKTLPHYHRVYLSFPAARTLQRSLPARRLRCATANSSHGWARRSRANWRCPQIPSVSITRRIRSAIRITSLPHKTRRLKRCWRWRKHYICGWRPSPRMPARWRTCSLR